LKENMKHQRRKHHDKTRESAPRVAETSHLEEFRKSRKIRWSRDSTISSRHTSVSAGSSSIGSRNAAIRTWNPAIGALTSK
jgi:hypothetical protein